MTPQSLTKSSLNPKRLNSIPSTLKAQLTGSPDGLLRDLGCPPRGVRPTAQRPRTWSVGSTIRQCSLCALPTIYIYIQSTERERERRERERDMYIYICYIVVNAGTYKTAANVRTNENVHIVDTVIPKSIYPAASYFSFCHVSCILRLSTGTYRDDLPFQQKPRSSSKLLPPKRLLPRRS